MAIGAGADTIPIPDKKAYSLHAMPESTNPEPVHTFDNGVKVCLRHLLAGQRRRYKKHNLHEPLETKLFEKMVRSFAWTGGALVDVGAALGYYTILARLLDPTIRVQAYEPLDVHRRYLSENLQLNGLAGPEVQIHPEAIGTQVGEDTFEVTSDRVGSRLADALGGAEQPKRSQISLFE